MMGHGNEDSSKILLAISLCLQVWWTYRIAVIICCTLCGNEIKEFVVFIARTKVDLVARIAACRIYSILHVQ